MATKQQLLAVLDQCANGSHLDDVPNHDDDSLREIAERSTDVYVRHALLVHVRRIEAVLRKPS